MDKSSNMKKPVGSIGTGRGCTTKPISISTNERQPTIPTPKKQTEKRIYVLDTNVFMHDPSCIFRFQEHDVYIPSTVLEELDNHKRGHEEINRNVREVTRIIDKIISVKDSNIHAGVSLKYASGGIATGTLFIQTDYVPVTNGENKPDNQILAAVEKLSKDKKPCEVVLVSKDINMRIKGRAIGVTVEDYHSDVAVEDTDLLYTGAFKLPNNFFEKNILSSEKSRDHTLYKICGGFVKKLLPNQFVFTEIKDEKPLNAVVASVDGNTAIIRTLTDHTHEKNQVSGILARNPEQNFALNLLLNPDIDIVTLVGKAGSGKTLLTLAAAIAQTVDDDTYSEIIFTRVTVPVGEDIGFLPGDETEKMNPWMGALDDNLDVLGDVPSIPKKGEKLHDLSQMRGSAKKDLIRSRIKVKSMSFMRGRTFLNKFLIIDEVQNLTAKQIKMLITRAGPGTKIVCLGNLSQIDTPYLTEGSSGLTYLVDRFKGWGHGGHITLSAGERSRLASHANDVL